MALRLLLPLLVLTAIGDSPLAGQHTGHESSAPAMAGPFLGASVGTARVPATESMPGQMAQRGAWMWMGHGILSLNVRRDPEPRGASEFFHTSMFMAHGRRRVGPGWLELQGMLSAEPALGPSGYTLLFQTGETADGENPLVDRQHPHDLFMGLSASYFWEVEADAWAFIYAAPVGSPALGPAPFMHRPSGLANPVAPISHHFLDATHIAYGVVTGGIRTDVLQLEVSWFNGHEPDERRWEPDRLGLNSFTGRLTVSPHPTLALQGSFGSMDEPERLHPAIDVYRVTLSGTHHLPTESGWWATTLAYGRNTKRETTMTLGEARTRLPGPLFDHYVGSATLPPGADDSLLLLFERRLQSALLVESAYEHGSVTAFARFERTVKDELFPPSDDRHSTAFSIGKAEFGGLVRAPLGVLKLSLGGAVALHWLATEVEELYGSSPKSAMAFAQLSF